MKEAQLSMGPELGNKEKKYMDKKYLVRRKPPEPPKIIK
jgi:hypothetical protein